MALEDRGVAVAEMAREVGVARSTAHYWLRGSIPREPVRGLVEAWIAA